MAVGARHVLHKVERLAGSIGAQLVTMQRRSVVARPESSVGTRIRNDNSRGERFERTLDVLPQEVVSLATPNNACPQCQVPRKLALEPGADFLQAWQVQARIDCVRRGPAAAVEQPSLFAGLP